MKKRKDVLTLEAALVVPIFVFSIYCSDSRLYFGYSYYSERSE